MYLLHRIGPRISSNWNTLEEILASEGPISFDGVYTEVYDNYRALKGKDITFFISGKYVGGDNSFDVGETPGQFCTWSQIWEMLVELRANLGYHGWAHRKCVGLDRTELTNELSGLPVGCNNIFAWPHGVCDSLAITAVEAMGFTEAWCAGPYGDGSQFQKIRNYLNW